MLTKLIRFDREEALLVKGPARVTAEEDGVTALSKPLRRGEATFIRKGKILPFGTDRATAVKLTLSGSESDYLVSRGGVGTRIWRDVVAQILEVPCRRAVVVGATDSGKSTLTMYILNEAISRGLKVGVIDEDVGQGDLAPPGCIGGKILQNQAFDLRELEADFFGFVGATSPRGVHRVVIGELRRVKDMMEAAKVDLYIVNTDGYVGYDGTQLKAEVIREVNPDIVVCFEEKGGGRELYKSLSEACGCSVIPARCSEYSVKSTRDRVGGRISQYRKFLSEGQKTNVDLRGINFTFLGRVYPLNLTSSRGASIVKGDGEGNTLTLEDNSAGWIDIIERGGGVDTVLGIQNLRGMFVGLGYDTEVLGFGLCGGLQPDFDLEVYTTFKGEVENMFLSMIRLTRDMGREYTIPTLRHRVR